MDSTCQSIPVYSGKWNLQFAVTPVIPKLIKATLYDF